MKNENKKSKALYHEITSVIRDHPEIVYIKKQIEMLLDLVEFESNGKLVKVDAFRLKYPSLFADVEESSRSIVAALARKCNLNCKFCYLKSNPDGLCLANSDQFICDEELDTRYRYKIEHRPLLSLNYEYNESLFNDRCYHYLKALRGKCSDHFLIHTNGLTLTEDKIRFLAELQPLTIIISLISSTPETRRKVMGDCRPHIALKSIELMNAAKIPFVVTITMWPDISLDDLTRTLHFLNSYELILCRIILPGYSGSYPDQQVFNRDVYWKKIATFIRKERAHLNYPVVILPVVYEETEFHDILNTNYVVCAIKNSPAYKKGIRAGDLIRSINGIQPTSRPFLKKLLKFCFLKKIFPLKLSIERNGEKRDVVICESDIVYEYPYLYDDSMDWGEAYGIIVPDGLSPLSLKQIHKTCVDENRFAPLILTSKLIKPLVEDYLKKLGPKIGLPEQVALCESESISLGGNIIIQDMMGVDDFIHTISKYAAKHNKPDVVFVPSSPFNSWGRDIFGKSFRKIEENVQIPCRMISNETIRF